MEATLGERGQVVIPKPIRDQLGLVPGTQLTFAVEGGKLIVRKKLDDAFTRARGMFKLPPGQTVDDLMRELRGRAPGDPIEPWEELRDDIPVPAGLRADHADRRAAWLAKGAAKPPLEKEPVSVSDLPARKRSPRRAEPRS